MPARSRTMPSRPRQGHDEIGHDQRASPLWLTVRDVDASAAWYEEVLGFRRVREFTAPDGARRKVFLRHDGLRGPPRALARLGMAAGNPFAKTRPGLDHLAFAVADREELGTWVIRLGNA